ncbi:hypothetical protein B0I35DRAFT_412534 [Stachybotrys elegans]|uniref:Uncharacterized protein n=1 Tax=Stachybotrys elegans TaxID=80388 RepID=A0A8K0SNL1_9HYPO|nr:hypothetical protein B0I35DRAFT_412534 [Stachybotrys elegans]
MHYACMFQLAYAGILFQGVRCAVVQDPGVPVVDRRAVPSKCNADNCARAATGTFDGLQPTRLLSCASFMRCTVTPTPVTVTNTITQTLAAASVTSVITVTDSVTVTARAPDLAPAKRAIGSSAGPAQPVTNCPTAVPTFASACKGTVRYSSACACKGYTQTYVTMAAVTETVTATVKETPADVTVSVTTVQTVTTTVSVSPAPYVAFPNPLFVFKLQITSGQFRNKYVLGSTGSTREGWNWVVLDSVRGIAAITPEGVMSENNYRSIRYRPIEGDIGTPINPNDPNFASLTFTTYSNDDGATLCMKPTGSVNPAHTKLQACPRDSDHPMFEAWIALDSMIRPGCSEITSLRVVPN